MDDIYAYIACEKKSPENAKSQTDRIWKAIASLEQFPEAHQERLTGEYAGRGYRQLIIDHYVAIFKVDQGNHIVHVVTIQYQGRNT